MSDFEKLIEAAKQGVFEDVPDHCSWLSGTHQQHHTRAHLINGFVKGHDFSRAANIS